MKRTRKGIVESLPHHLCAFVKETKRKRYYVTTYGEIYSISKKTGRIHPLCRRSRYQIGDQVFSREEIIIKAFYQDYLNKWKAFPSKLYHKNGDRKDFSRENLALRREIER